MDENPLDRIRSLIEQTTGPGQQTGPRRYELRCPAHPDHDPSLGLTENTNQHTLIYCQAGCTTTDVLTAIGLTLRDLYPLNPDNRQADPVIATYRYIDEQGELLYEVQRTTAKKFRQRRPDPAKPSSWIYKLDGVRRVLYRLPAVMQAIREGQTIYLPEGEKDVHTLELDGHVATTSPGGVGKWRPEYTETLRGAHVVVICDRDVNGAGVRHGRNVAFLLQPVAASVTLLQPAAGKDYTDHHTAGLGVDDLQFVPTEVATPASEPLPGQTEPQDGTADQPVSPAPTTEQEVGARIRLTPASAFKMRAVRWVWQDRMPLGEICLIPGREGIGKSTYLAWLAAEITRGNLPGIYHGEPRAVLYAASEDAWDYTVAPRLFAAGANLDMVYRIDVVEEDGIPGKLVLPVHTRLIPAKAEEVKAAILMCDPILSNLSDRINPNHAKELRSALEPLRDAAERAGIAVAALAHFNKSRDVDAGSMVSGSRAWMEVARASILIAREQRGEEENQQWVQVLTQHKNNLGSLDLPSLEYRIANHQFTLDDGEEIRIGRLEWLGNSETTADEILARKPGQRPSEGSGRPVGEQILDLLEDAGRAMNPTEIMHGLENAGSTATYNTVKQRLHQMTKSGRIARVGTGLYKAPDQVTVPGVSPGAVPRARTRPPPDVTVTRNLPKPKYMREREREGYVTSEGGGVTVTVGGGGDHNLDRNLETVVACQACFGPMTRIDPDQIYHPTCEPDDTVVDLEQEEPQEEENEETTTP